LQLDETLDHKLLPVLGSIQNKKFTLQPYKNFKKFKVLSKESPIYSSKTCLKVSEHSFEKLPEDNFQKIQKKISLQIEVNSKSSYEHVERSKTRV